MTHRLWNGQILASPWGLRGTEVAREASDMVLGDDALSSVVTAVALGRVIFGNIRKFVVYLLSCNTSEVMVVGLASLVNAPLPILPLQILFLNLVTDVFPALALGVGRGDPAGDEAPAARSEGTVSPGEECGGASSATPAPSRPQSSAPWRQRRSCWRWTPNRR